MRDAVAEVLAQRTAIDRGGAAGLALSIILHVSLTVLAVYAAMNQPAPRQVSALNIRFAQAPQPVVPAAPVPKPAAPRIEPPKPELVKPPEKTARPPERNTAPMSPFGRSSKKGSENPATPPKPTPQPAAPAAPQVAVGQTGVTGLEGGDFPYTVYIDRMKTLIGTHWFRPQITGEPNTVVYFVIERDGRIRDAKVTTPSGNATFDRAALRSILETSPLPPLPFAYNGTYLGVHLTFR